MVHTTGGRVKKPTHRGKSTRERDLGVGMGLGRDKVAMDRSMCAHLSPPRPRSRAAVLPRLLPSVFFFPGSVPMRNQILQP